MVKDTGFSAQRRAFELSVGHQKSYQKETKTNKSLFLCLAGIIIKAAYGELAQLGEHCAGSAKVTGSSPVFSTKPDICKRGIGSAAVRETAPQILFLIWGMGLHGVDTCLASKNSDEFDSHILHQWFSLLPENRGGLKYNVPYSRVSADGDESIEY